MWHPLQFGPKAIHKRTMTFKKGRKIRKLKVYQQNLKVQDMSRELHTHVKERFCLR